MPYACNFNNSLLWGIVSKAFFKSKQMTSTKPFCISVNFHSIGINDSNNFTEIEVRLIGR